MQVCLRTNYGPITIELFPAKAPLTVANFSNYVNANFYDNVLLHRVIPRFTLQAGTFGPGMKPKPATRDPIPNEADNGLKHARGAVAMHRRGSDPHSATTEFFINLADNDYLNHSGKNVQGWGYAVFGQVVDGLDVVDRIGYVYTGL
jgi:peptidyl-prolyl cis-trans isomerase B (cyclophilin B)